ncbi:LacI family DNA-binding transcriptional regulator [Azoarcus sp. KH32C]|uniref:LacI family DNA-binding transcriptional regulator n=1 Tax=Azoarcus sp. KH32C TaxID=748247 RepID=UPI0005A0FEB5|nr:LacI family DNA-binding transcriptional regulator [Azoarcus sp. KH32C]
MKTTERKTRATGRATLSDVAREAQVSPITASRALRGVDTVDPELAERVRSAAAALGYVPNPAARALASARSDTVVVLVPSLTNAVFVDVLEAIYRILQPAGYEVLIGNSHYDREEEERLIRNYLAHRPSGLIVTGFDRTEAARRLIEASKIPSVHLMELAQAPGVYCVGLSQSEAGATVARHLLQRGRRRLAFVAAQLDPRTLQRGEGFRRALIEAGCYDPALELLTPAPSSMALGGELLVSLLERHPDVDGIFFNNDDLAQGALLEALRRGIPVPQRVAVVGFNDLEGAAHMVPRLTTIRTPREEMGRRAAELLLAVMRGETVKVPAVDVGFELVTRESS